MVSAMKMATLVAEWVPQLHNPCYCAGSLGVLSPRPEAPVFGLAECPSKGMPLDLRSDSKDTAELPQLELSLSWAAVAPTFNPSI